MLSDTLRQPHFIDGKPENESTQYQPKCFWGKPRKMTLVGAKCKHAAAAKNSNATRYSGNFPVAQNPIVIAMTTALNHSMSAIHVAFILVLLFSIIARNCIKKIKYTWN